MRGLVHFLGVEGQTAERAQRGWHLQTWLEALPAEPAGDMDLRLLLPCQHVQSGSPVATNSSGDNLMLTFPPPCWLRGELSLPSTALLYVVYPLQPVPNNSIPGIG